MLLTGLALGLSPAGRILCDASAASAFIAEHSSSPFVAWELSVVLGVVRCCWETVELMASGTLALQALVLAASLFSAQPPAAVSASSAGTSSPDAAAAAAAQQQDPAGEGYEEQGLSSGLNSSGSLSQAGTARGTVELVSPGGGRSDLAQPLVLGSSGIMASAAPLSSSSSLGSSFGGSSGGSVVNVRRASARTADDASASVLQQLKPQSEWEWRAMLAVAAVRFVLLPAATCVLVLGTFRAGLLPPDPACVFMLLLQSCMPPGELG